MSDAGKLFNTDIQVFARVIGKTPAGTHATVLSAPFRRPFLAKLCRRDGKLFYTGDQEIVFPLPTAALRHIYTDSDTDPNPEFVYMETVLEGTAHLVYMGPDFGYVQQYYRIRLVAQEYHGALATNVQLAPPPLPLLQVGTAVFEPPTAAPELPSQAPELPSQAPELPTQAPEKAPKLPELPTQVSELPSQAPELPTQMPKLPTQMPRFWPPRVINPQDSQDEISFKDNSFKDNSFKDNSFKAMVAKWCQEVPLVSKQLTSKQLTSKQLTSNQLTSKQLTSNQLTPTVQTPQEDGAAPCGYCGDCNACWNRERRGGRGGQRRKM